MKKLILLMACVLVITTVKAQTFQHNLEQLKNYVKTNVPNMKSTRLVGNCEHIGIIDYNILDDVIYAYEQEYGILFPSGATGSNEEVEQFKNFRIVMKDQKIVENLIPCYLYLESLYIQAINKMDTDHTHFELHKLQYLMYFTESCYKASGENKKAREAKKRRKQYRLLELASGTMSNVISETKQGLTLTTIINLSEFLFG